MGDTMTTSFRRQGANLCAFVMLNLAMALSSAAASAQQTPGAATATVAASSTLASVRKRGQLVCGVGQDLVGFSELSAANEWRGLDIEYCRAVAAAIFADKERVVFRAVPTADRFRALRSGELDILARGAGWTFSRDTAEGVRFVGALFHDSGSLLVRRTQGVSSALELSGASICLLAGSETETQVTTFFSSRGMRFQPIAAATWSDLIKAYEARRCTALAGDLTHLAAERVRLGSPGDHVLLPERLSHAPIGPVVRRGDDQWFDLTRWVIFALIAGEIHGLDGANVASRATSSEAELRFMLGTEGNPGGDLELGRQWVQSIIRQVGTYGHIYERTLGAASILKLSRGMNALARDGGLMWAPPFR